MTDESNEIFSINRIYWREKLKRLELRNNFLSVGRQHRRKIERNIEKYGFLKKIVRRQLVNDVKCKR